MDGGRVGAPIHVREWTVSDRPGIEIVVAPNDHVMAQVLEDGFAFTWTTEKSAAEAVGTFLRPDDPGASAVALAPDTSRFIELEEAQIFPFLCYHECSWIRLRRDGEDDSVVYLRGEVDQSNELVVVSSAIDNIGQGEARARRVQEMMALTASPPMRRCLDSVWRSLIDRLVH